MIVLSFGVKGHWSANSLAFENQDGVTHPDFFYFNWGNYTQNVV